MPGVRRNAKDATCRIDAPVQREAVNERFDEHVALVNDFLEQHCPAPASHRFPAERNDPDYGVIVGPSLPIELASASFISRCASSWSMKPSATALFADAVTRET